MSNDRPDGGDPSLALRPGPAAVCPGTVVHHRLHPADHRFTYPVAYVWLDPDHPEHLTDQHPLWSARRPAPAWFRRSDHLDGGRQPLGAAVRALVADHLPAAPPTGPVRMLTQVRTWGWLFNPITVYLLWADDPGGDPEVAVLEVTNTPWKERHRYVVPLARLRPLAATAPNAGSGLGARFGKVLHVSPFLHEEYSYDLIVRSPPPGPAGRSRLVIELDVIPRIQNGEDHEPQDMEPTGSSSTEPGSRDGGAADGAGPGPILRTRLAVERLPADRAALNGALLRYPLSTHRVSAGIHRQAVRLWRKGVPIVAHPRRRQRGAPPDQPVDAPGVRS